MKVLKTEVQPDYLEKLLRLRPTAAIAELIWNALDADADRVEVDYERDFTGGLSMITVRDNGTGISELDAEAGFRQLGGSWKRSGGLTRRDRRVLHGQEGEGRFTAFALGATVEWRSIAEAKTGNERLSISSSRDRLGEFRVSDVELNQDGPRGTEVEISEIPEAVSSLLGPAATDELTEIFALYLRQYPNVCIEVAGQRIDPESLESFRQDYRISPFTVDGDAVDDAVLTVVEWRKPTSRSLFLCNSDGIARHNLSMAKLRAPGFEFTAYLRSSYVQKLYESNDLFMGNTHAGVDAMYHAAMAQLKDHFRRRAAERDSELVNEWKSKGLYPFEGEPSTVAEVTERQVFDVVAVNVNAYLPDFPTASTKTKQFSFQLLREAIQTSPHAMQRILTDVLGLPKNRLDELAELLEKTSLASIIAASKLVADRLNFLHALELMLFEPDIKKQLLERRQLHRILADHTWIFGEEYNLAVDDESLTAVLRQHVKLLGRQELAPPAPVRGSGGKQQIVDMMLSKTIPQNRAEEREHLIIELKRPNQKVDQKVFNQVSSYALAVAKDERFRDVNTNWIFWALSNDRDDFVDAQSRSPGRPRGVIGQFETPRITIWAKTWGDVINEARARLEFFRRQLNYSVDSETSLDSLRKTHERYFPPALARSTE